MFCTLCVFDLFKDFSSCWGPMLKILVFGEIGFWGF